MMKTRNHQNLRLFLLLCFSLLIFFFVGASSVHCSKEGEEKERSRDDVEQQNQKREAFLGVDPLHAHEYDRTKLIAFSCENNNDEKIEIDFARVNDNFCDCPTDGSDEPGTNACSGITPQQKQRGFYCQNLGSKPKLIKSSFVNDNVCDCCDGSDEKFNAKKHCENTCANDGREAMESLREEVRNFEIGVGKKRNEYAKKAKNAKKEAEKEVVRLRKAVEQLREEKEKKEAEEEKAKEVFREHEKLKEERDREKEEEERKRREKEEEEEKNRDHHHHHHPDDESKEEREMREMEEEMREIEREEAAEKTSGDDNDERESEEAKKEVIEEREETDEERGRRIAEQWVHGDDNDRSEGEEKEGEEEDFIDGDYDGHHDPYDEEDDYGGEDGYYPPYDDDSDQREEQEATKEEEKVGMFGRMKRMVMGGDKKKAKHEDNKLEEEERALEDARKIKNEASRKASEAREKFEESNTKLSTFNAKIEKLSSTTEDETTKLLVGALSDQCFSTKADKYTYEICLFGQSKQDNHVRLGDMKSEITFDDLTGKRFAKFENGEKCWNGPKRSMTVELVCGSKESLFDVQEPSRCEYSSKFTTPIACDENQLEMKKIELNKLAEREKNNYSSKEGEEVEYVVNY